MPFCSLCPRIGRSPPPVEPARPEPDPVVEALASKVEELEGRLSRAERAAGAAVSRGELADMLGVAEADLVGVKIRTARDKGWRFLASGEEGFPGRVCAE